MQCQRCSLTLGGHTDQVSSDSTYRSSPDSSSTPELQLPALLPTVMKVLIFRTTCSEHADSEAELSARHSQVLPCAPRQRQELTSCRDGHSTQEPAPALLTSECATVQGCVWVLAGAAEQREAQI